MKERDAAWERAERFVRDVLAMFGQKADDATVNAVTAKVLKATFREPSRPTRPRPES